jgi:spore germination protein YaaH
MHAMGKTLSVAVSPKSADVPNHPRSTFFDYAQLSQSADAIFVMAWGIHWATSGPGPQDDLPWVTSVADYVATMPLKRKFVMGTQLYAMDWPTGGANRAATAYEYDDVGPLLQRTGATPRYDATSDAYTFDYTDAAGIPHTVWYTDAATQARRFQLARDRGLGAGVWRLGREHQSLWDSPLLAPGTSWP